MRRSALSPAVVVLAALLVGAAPPVAADAGATRIHDIQGTAHLSPLLGDPVADVPGVVTALDDNRFWMQDPEPDTDPATSEAVVVFTRDRPTVAVGDAVAVTGTVDEFRPGPDSGDNLTTTEIVSPTVEVTGRAEPPPATTVGPDGRRPPGEVVDDDATGSVETSGQFDAGTDGIDFWESMEGMRVAVRDAEVVGPTNRFGELAVVPPGAGPRSVRGGVVLRADDANPERLLLDDVLAPMATADVGDTLPGDTVGVLDYTFGAFKLEVLATPEVLPGGLAPEVTRAPRGGELAVATFNVENLDPTDPPEKFARLADIVVTNLAAPDLVAVEEIQDNTGPANDGVVAADRTFTMLTDAIVAAGGPRYDWRQVDPVDGQDGGQPGGNIRVGFLFRTDRGLSFVDRPGGDSTTPTEVVGRRGRPRLSLSPGRVQPADPAFADSRKPLAGEFRFRGRRLFVVATHFASKGGDQPLFGRFQPPARESERQRHQQAQVVHDFVADILRLDREAFVLVVGDVNDFEFSRTAEILTDGGVLLDLPRTLPVGERYTFVFEGNSQVLDHILVSPAVVFPVWWWPRWWPVPWRVDYDIVHVGSEFADRVSDHDPQVVRLRGLR